MQLTEAEVKTAVTMNNEVRKYINKVVKKIIPHLEPFIGKKLIRADSTLVQKAQTLIEWPQGIKVKSPEGTTARIDRPYFKVHRYSLTLCVQIVFINDKGCKYVYETVTIAELDHQVLVSINDAPMIINKPAQEAKKYAKALKLKEQYRNAASQLALPAHRDNLR
jgi:hypothetical protein